MYSSFKAPRPHLLTLGVCHLALTAGCILIPVDEVRRNPREEPNALDGGGSGLDGNSRQNDVSDASAHSSDGDSSENTDRSNSSHSEHSDSSALAKTDATSNSTLPTTSVSEGASSSEEPTGDTTSSTNPTSEERPRPDCGLLVSDPALGVYVSLDGADNDECGSPEAPCQTITRGLSRAETEHKNTLYVAQGTYAEHVNLTSPLSLLGGWTVNDGVWTRECAKLSRTTTIKSTTPIGLRAEFAGTARLQSLTIESKAKDNTPSESRYGVFATGSGTNLELVDVTVRAATANDGANGVDGTRGADGANGADGAADPNSRCESGDGQPGAAPAATPTTAQGSFTSSGYVPNHGVNGANGNPGQAGPRGTERAHLCTFCSMSETQCKIAHSETRTASGGLNGCGGGAGSGGFGGTGGGSSLGVFAWFATVNFGEDVSVIAGDGGNGGAGGAGGSGGSGEQGNEGNEVACNSFTCNSLPCDFKFRGNPGGKGGDGSAGAPGAGGAGGWSIAIYQTPDATTGQPLTVVGQAGENSGSGAAGLAQAM